MISVRFTNRRFFLMSLCLGLCGVCGCGGAGAIELTSSQDDAKKVLVQALEAWKAGDTTQKLMDQTDSIVVADEDWEASRKLTAYELTEAGIENGGHWRMPVTLTFETDAPVAVFYAVTPGKPASIIRSDFTD
jgi:hypothetical protein